MSKYKAISLDIDGTLTNNKKEITKGTKEAVKRAVEHGKVVIVASGRPSAGIRKVAEELELEQSGGYILAFNGARITDCKTNEIVYQDIFPHNMIPALYNEAVKHKVGLITYENDVVICGCNRNKYTELEAKINGIPIRDIKDFDTYVTFDVNKCLMSGEPDQLAELERLMQEKYGDQLSIYRSEPFFLEFMPKGVDKANALNHLLQKLSLNKEELIAIGDGFNDVSMIQYAGLGVAMGNAQEVVKEAADLVTVSNEEDGVANIIYNYLL